MSESKTKLQAELERYQAITRAAADVLDIAADYYEGCSSDELQRLLAPLHAAIYSAKDKS